MNLNLFEDKGKNKMGEDKSDGWKIFSVVFILFLPEIIGLWLTKLPWSIETHIKIIYSILYSLAISIFIYFILSRTEDRKEKRSKKHGKK